MTLDSFLWNSSIFALVFVSSPLLGQLQFGGGASSKPGGNENPTIVVGKNDTDNRFFFDGPGGLPSTGNEGLDGGIIGLGVGAGLGAVGAAVLGPVVQGALNQNSCGRGRKKRQTSFPGSSSGSGSQSPEFSQTGGGGGGDQELDGDERFFLPSGGSCSCNGRRKRQAPAEADINNRFFGLGHLLNLGGNVPHCGSCCYGNNNNGGFNNNNNGGFNNNNGGFNNNNGGFNNNNNGGFHNNNNGGFNNNNGGFHNNNNGGFNNGGQSQNQGNSRCQCEYSLTFRDRYGNVHGACKRRDSSGRTWCYTTGWHNRACQDLKASQKFRNNPWSYSACGSSRNIGG